QVEPAKPFVKRRGAKPAEASASEPATPRAAPATPWAAPAPKSMPQPAAQPLDALIDSPGVPPEDETAPRHVTQPAPIDGPQVKVLSGIRAGKAFALTKPETTLGRPGVQVAAILRTETGFRIRPVEGISPPILNGGPVAAGGMDLAPGDVIEIVGTRVEFVDPSPGRSPAPAESPQASHVP